MKSKRKEILLDAKRLFNERNFNDPKDELTQDEFLIDVRNSIVEDLYEDYKDIDEEDLFFIVNEAVFGSEKRSQYV